MLRTIEKKNLSELIAEWDALAPLRRRQISSGDDISYTRIIVPAVLNLVSSLKPSRVLDAGCGIGVLSAQMSHIANEVIGVDPSGRSIEIARELNAGRASFFQDTIEHFSLHNSNLFDVIVANMVLMDVLDLDEFLSACSRMVSKSGYLIFSLTHPCFWPIYYGYNDEPWFQYQEQQIVEGPFRITADPVGSLISTHIHRPLSAYSEAFKRANFRIVEMQEPIPSADLDKKYLSRWKLPRYLIGCCVQMN
jgi:SAM-dependent methyltransferase